MRIYAKVQLHLVDAKIMVRSDFLSVYSFSDRINLKHITAAEVSYAMTQQTANAVSREQVYEALKDVYDPEIPVNVVDLGLIYDVDVEDNEVFVEMTLTAQGCGMGPYIAQQAEWRIAEIEHVEDVEVDLVFDPPWNPDMITEDGKRLLGID